jgi:hypothetical protein
VTWSDDVVHGTAIQSECTSRAAWTKPRRREVVPDLAKRQKGPAPRASVEQIPIDRIDLTRRPARRFLGDIPALAESMNDYGLQQPVSVRADGPRFILTSGMRRLGARMLQWESIPGFIRSVNADDAYLLDLIENLQREDLSPEEEADVLGELIRRGAPGGGRQNGADPSLRAHSPNAGINRGRARLLRSVGSEWGRRV